MLQSIPKTERSVCILVVVTAFILGIIAAIFLYTNENHALIYYGDSVSHLSIARRVVDWIDPGLKQLGTIWLPLPHLMLLPFSLIQPFFTSGVAGLMVSLPSLAVSSLFLYKMIAPRLRNALSIGYLTTLVYSSNASILYLGIVAMTEAPFMLFFIASAYYFWKWNRKDLDSAGNLANLVKCSIFVVLASLCRYEGWALPPMLLLIVATKFSRKPRIDFPRKSKLKIFGIASLSMLGLAIWFAWNYYYYNDAIRFANDRYNSPLAQSIDRPYRESLFLKPLNVLAIYSNIALQMYGPVLIVFSAMGVITYILIRNEIEVGLPSLLLYLSAPVLFTLTSLTSGVAEIGNWFNARFLIFLAPLLIVLASRFIGIVAERTRQNKIVLAGLLGVLLLNQILIVTSGTIVTYIDARLGYQYKQSPFATTTAEILHLKYTNGLVMMLTGSSQANRIMLSSGIKLSRFDDILDSSTWKESFKEPWKYEKWIVISKVPDHDSENVTRYWIKHYGQLQKYFVTLYQNKYYIILAHR